MTPKPDDRSALSIGMDWATRISTIGLEFALPALLGFGLDRWRSTGPWLTISGAMFGLLAGTLHMIRLATSLEQSSPRTRWKRNKTTPRPPGVADRDETP